MSGFLGSVRKSLVFRSYPGPTDDASSASGITEKIRYCLRKSRVGIGLGLGFPPKCPSTPPQPIVEDDVPPIRWRKEELIGSGAFGHVYKGMNLDSGGLLAIKQVLIGASSASKEKAQAHIRELHDEIKLLKNLSHANIHRDKKGASILVDNKGCIKFADFGASKQVASGQRPSKTFVKPVCKSSNDQIWLVL